MDFVRSNFGTNEPLLCVCAANRPKSEEKSVLLAEIHLYRIYFLQNPYFNENQICIGAKSFNFWSNKFSFEQQHQNTGLKTRNGEKLSLS